MLKGVLIVLGAVAVSGCDKLGSASAPVGPPVGRWSIVHSPHVQRDTMLLDTATGDTWQLVQLGRADSDGLGWQYVGKLDGSSAKSESAGTSAPPGTNPRDNSAQETGDHFNVDENLTTTDVPTDSKPN